MAGPPDMTLLRRMLEALPEPAILLDGNGRIAIANDAACDRLGVWVLGKSYVSALRQPGLLGPVEDALSDGQAGRARFTHSSGAVESLFDVHVTPLGDGPRGMVMLVFRDLSEARAGESMRRDFVANVSHELKTPLTAVMGFIETLQGPARSDPAAQQRFLALMEQETARMNRLVSDLLSLSRLEGQARRRPTDEIDLSRLVGEVIEMLRPGAGGVTFVSDGPDSAPAPGDRDQLIQVMSNLVENAVKYGADAGTVRVALAPIAREPVLKGPAWRITVVDDGPGIAPEHLPRLTERFYRVDTGRSRQQGGTGLGLAIVKHIVNRHRGRLRIDSREGRGTTVEVVLPALSPGPS